jgi:hypothetical protein
MKHDNKLDTSKMSVSILDPGFSVYVEHNKFQNTKNKEVQNSSFEFQNDTDNNLALNNIYPKFNKKWIDSNVVHNCQLCISPFGYLTRKHHCRACGHVFCSDCCQKYIKIPKNIKIPEEDNTYRQQIVNLYKYQKTFESLVCDECYNKIKNLENIAYYANIAEFLDLKTLYITLKVSKKWYNACIHHLSKFREIQYKSNKLLYDKWEINIMSLSSDILLSHSYWKTHLIKSYIQEYYETLDKKTLDKINTKISKKKCSCWTLMCTRRCHLKLDLLDYIEILRFVSLVEETKKIRILWKNDDLKTFLLNILHDICYISNDININIFKSSIPLFCSFMTELLNNFWEDIDINFVKKMIDEIIIYPEALYSLYDELEYLRSTDNKNLGIMNMHDILKDYLNTHTDLNDKIKNMIKSISILIDNSTENIQNKMTLPILYPLNYNWNIIKINKCIVMNSSSKPLLLDVVICDEMMNMKNVKFLIKKENSLRKEQLVSCLIYLLLFKLRQHELKNNKIIDKMPTYQIKMLTKNIGIIEFVEDSITLREIIDKGYTIKNFILEKNKKEIYDVVQKRFTTSLAISCCLSYILGLGDRHLDNIMINNKGQIFNIDFGYLLEHPMTNILGAPNIKLTSDMVDFLGGVKSEYYKYFTKYLIYVYDIIRLYKNIIVSHYEMIGNENLLNWSVFQDKLESRFLSGLHSKEFEIILINEIESSASISNSFNDACHKLKIWWSKS